LGYSSSDALVLHRFYTYKDILVVLLFAFLAVLLVFFEPYLLSNPVNCLPVDMIFTPKKMVPEWYFLPFYAMLRSISSRGGGLLLVVSLFVYLFLLPSISRQQVCSGDLQIGFQVLFSILVVIFICLGWCGGQSLDDPWIGISRGCTWIFFLLLFVIFPLFIRAQVVLFGCSYFFSLKKYIKVLPKFYPGGFVVRQDLIHILYRCHHTI